MDYIKIEGYKSIKEMYLELKPINLLIGSNGSGKSNFISFFEFLNNLQDKHLREYVSLRGGIEKFVHKGSEHTQEIKFELSFGKGINGYEATLKNGVEHFVISREYLVYQGKKDKDISNFNAEANIKNSDHYRAKYVLNHLNSYRKYHFHDTGKKSPFTQMSNTNIISMKMAEI